MAVYYVIVNHDKREYISPPALGDGAKLREFWHRHTAAAFLMLLAPEFQNAFFGRWCGDRVELVPDCTGLYDGIVYGDETMLPYFDISNMTRDVLSQHSKSRDQDHAGVVASDRDVWLLTTGDGSDDGDPWKVISCHASEQSANQAKEVYERPIPRVDGTMYRRQVTVECWGLFP